MRYFFTIREPQVSRILLVESGSRGLLEGIIPGIRKTYGHKIFVDLVTCYSGLPEGFHPENTLVYRVTDYRGRAGRARLYRELARVWVAEATALARSSVVSFNLSKAKCVANYVGNFL